MWKKEFSKIIKKGAGYERIPLFIYCFYSLLGRVRSWPVTGFYFHGVLNEKKATYSRRKELEGLKKDLARRYLPPVF
jgi:hypothetical protein